MIKNKIIHSIQDFKALQRRNALYTKELKRKPTKAELVVSEFLTEWGIKFIFQKGFLTPIHRIVDFYIPAGGIIIEVDGGYHKNTRQLDYYKDGKWCDIRGMNTIRITNEQVFNGSFKEILSKKLFLSGIEL